jgi:hypothetical protein
MTFPGSLALRPWLIERVLQVLLKHIPASQNSGNHRPLTYPTTYCLYTCCSQLPLSNTTTELSLLTTSIFQRPDARLSTINSTPVIMAYFPQPTQFRYPQCDSYWVESEDEGLYAMRAEARERHRAIARMQQRAIGEELSRLTADEYQEDVIEHMMHMEVSIRASPPIGILTMPVTNTA